MSNGRGAQMQLGCTVPSVFSSRGTTAAIAWLPERVDDIRVAPGDRLHVGIEEQQRCRHRETASAWLTAAA